MADVPSLNVLDVSNGNPITGTINAAAVSIGWLQDGINYFLSVFPWAGNATSAAVTFSAGTATIAQPEDFILDLRDGLTITIGTTRRRLKRRGLQDVISLGLNEQAGPPRVYCAQGTNLLVAPTPDVAYTGLLWYWNRPAALASGDVPAFPSDLVLVQYVRIMAMEWIRAVPPNSALQYADMQIAKLRKAGLGSESEHDTIPLDTGSFIPGAGLRDVGNTSWMGDIA